MSQERKINPFDIDSGDVDADHNANNEMWEDDDWWDDVNLDRENIESHSLLNHEYGEEPYEEEYYDNRRRHRRNNNNNGTLPVPNLAYDPSARKSCLGLLWSVAGVILIALLFHSGGNHRDKNQQQQEEQKQKNLPNDNKNKNKNNIDDNIDGNNNKASLQNQYFISIVGELEANFDWLQETLDLCFPSLPISSGLHHRPGFVMQDKHEYTNHVTAVVAIFNDPYASIQAYRRDWKFATSHRYANGTAWPWRKFVSHPWTILDEHNEPISSPSTSTAHSGSNETCQYGLSPLQVMPCDNDDDDKDTMYELKGQGKPFDSILEFRAAHVQNVMSLSDTIFTVHAYELQQETAMNKVIDLLSLISAATNHSTYQCDPQFLPPIPEVKYRYTRNYWEYMNEHVNWETEKLIGYSQLTFEQLKGEEETLQNGNDDDDNNDSNDDDGVNDFNDDEDESDGNNNNKDDETETNENDNGDINDNDEVNDDTNDNTNDDTNDDTDDLDDAKQDDDDNNNNNDDNDDDDDDDDEDDNDNDNNNDDDEEENVNKNDGSNTTTKVNEIDAEDEIDTDAGEDDQDDNGDRKH